LLSIAFRLEKTAYRYASITLTIIVLIPRSAPAWTIALHTFLEVSVGMIVALAVVALWPEHQPSAVKSAGEKLAAIFKWEADTTRSAQSECRADVLDRASRRNARR
jgi:uncharacterized membrane protein YgaE (UPF0421/DUF939 family)